MLNIFLDSLFDTLKALPFLLVVYFLIELIEGKYSPGIDHVLVRARKMGPFFGAVFGVIPQCGFSVASSSFYSRRALTLGTLMAIYLSTSDEAFPILLSYPDKAISVLPLLGVKVFMGIFFGFLIDLVYRRRLKKDIGEQEICVATNKGCCGHKCGAYEKKNFKKSLWHPLVHTLKIGGFLFVFSFLINLVLYLVGEDVISQTLLGTSTAQPFIAALVGLIPNCAASVAIADLFAKGILGFGATVAGLSSNAGLGMVVLFKEHKNLKENILILVLLFAISSFSGLVLQYIIG